MSAKIPTASTSVGVAEPEKARLKGSLFELAELIQRRDELIAKLTEAGKVVRFY